MFLALIINNMDKWIVKFVDKYNGMMLDDLSPISIRHLPKGFRRFVSDHLFYYEKITTKTSEDSHFNFILVYRSTPFRFNVDFYLGNVFIYVGVVNEQYDYVYYLPIGKYLISDFLYNFVSGQELEEVQSKETKSYNIDDDQFEIPF